MDRLTFLKLSGMVAGGTILGFPAISRSQRNSFTSLRPPMADRNFTSKAVEETIAKVKSQIKNQELAWLFENCFPNTLDTTVKFSIKNGRPDTFVITGDIEAMWLRDSTAQVWPYLPLCTNDEQLSQLIAGVINRQTQCILIDPYANAFNDGPGESEWMNDLTEMKPELHERKWEIDSLCYPIRLAYNYWKTTKDISCFDQDWLSAMRLVVKTFRQQQRKDDKGPYKFQRVTGWQTDTVAGAGYGNPIRPIGLICSIFRPSDDATIYPFLIPSNFFAVLSLRQLAEMATSIHGDSALAMDALELSDEVEKALRQYAIVNHPIYGPVYAYEIDGFGNHLFMDDANVPSLLAMPYLGLVGSNDEVYQNTRNLVLSNSNPYFFKGKAAEGIGGPHVGLDMIWPMSIIMRAFTSDDQEEIAQCIHTLQNTHGGTGFMHESFHKDDPENFTRKWFAWANTLFGELILDSLSKYPKIVQG
jgi:meiotically up-regulated gene 157 (Mug157) protein